MARNIEHIIEENGLTQKLGEAGRKRVKENFTMERHLDTLTDCIERAMNPGH